MKKVYILAAIAALITAALLYFYLSDLAKKEVVPHSTVVIAAVDIPAYTKISAEQLTTMQIPSEFLHHQALRDPKEAIGLVSDGAIIAGETLLSGSLRTLGESNDGMSYLIPDGMRALTVEVDTMSGVAGYLRQNDRVDVLVTMGALPDDEAAPAADGEPKGRTATAVVAENIQVLAAGATIADKNEDGAAAGYGSVTLLAAPDEARRIVFACQEGRLTLLLRSVTDEAQDHGEAIDRDNVEIK